MDPVDDAVEVGVVVSRHRTTCDAAVVSALPGACGKLWAPRESFKTWWHGWPELTAGCSHIEYGGDNSLPHASVTATESRISRNMQPPNSH